MQAGSQRNALDADLVRRRFGAAAATFDTADFVHATTRDGLLARLEPVTIEAGVVVDLGCATGAARPLLEKRFRGALVVGCDFARPMLAAAARTRHLFRKPALVAADAHALPFADASVDVVFANLLLPWIGAPDAVFAEVSRVLRRDGLFAFSTLGPDSFAELVAAWRAGDDRPHVHAFPDMHDVGDAAIRAGLKEPVLDVDRITVTYREPAQLFADLGRAGARNALAGRARGLTSRSRFARVLAALDAGRVDGAVPVGLEVVYGHCWGAGPRTPAGEYRIDAARIGRRGR